MEALGNGLRGQSIQRLDHGGQAGQILNLDEQASENFAGPFGPTATDLSVLASIGRYARDSIDEQIGRHVRPNIDSSDVRDRLAHAP